MKNYGIILEDIVQEDIDFVLGAQPLEILQPDRDWTPYLPPLELQNKGEETFACVTFSCLNTIETFGARKYGLQWNKSDRFTAKMSGTIPGQGNSFKKVMASVRKDGVTDEEKWPFNVITVQDFYKPIPQEIIEEAKLSTIDIEFEYRIFTQRELDPEVLWEKLQYAPIQVGVCAWDSPVNGVYLRNNLPVNHAVMLYKGEYKKFWYIYDHYDKSVKKLAWDFNFGAAQQNTFNLNHPMYLVKLSNRPEVYAVDKNNKKHYIPNLAQLHKGTEIGVWGKEDSIRTISESDLVGMEEGVPIQFGII